MQLGMLARFCCRVAGYSKVTFLHTHTMSTAALRSAFRNAHMLNEAAIIYTVACQSIWSRAGSSGILFLFRKLQWLVLFAVAIHPRKIATIVSRQDRGPPSFHPSMVQHLRSFLSIAGGTCLWQMLISCISCTHGSSHISGYKMC
jgi:hypothetical protein